MIENRNYVGNDKYPPIISDEIYTIANQKKQEKGSQKTVLPPITEHIKNIMLCECCGSRFRRINKWRRREKWKCTGGCKCDTYLDDIGVVSTESIMEQPPVGILLELKRRNCIRQSFDAFQK